MAKARFYAIRRRFTHLHRGVTPKSTAVFTAMSKLVAHATNHAKL